MTIKEHSVLNFNTIKDGIAYLNKQYPLTLEMKITMAEASRPVIEKVEKSSVNMKIEHLSAYLAIHNLSFCEFFKMVEEINEVKF